MYLYENVWFVANIAKGANFIQIYISKSPLVGVADELYLLESYILTYLILFLDFYVIDYVLISIDYKKRL